MLVKASRITAIGPEHPNLALIDWCYGSPPTRNEKKYVLSLQTGGTIVVGQGFMDVFEVNVDDWVIQWSSGLITVRKEVSFRRDFKPFKLSDHSPIRLFETNLRPLFDGACDGELFERDKKLVTDEITQALRELGRAVWENITNGQTVDPNKTAAMGNLFKEAFKDYLEKRC